MQLRQRDISLGKIYLLQLLTTCFTNYIHVAIIRSLILNSKYTEMVILNVKITRD